MNSKPTLADHNPNHKSDTNSYVKYRINPLKSKVTFSVTKLLVHSVHGKFTAFDGTIHLNNEDFEDSKVMAKVAAVSIDTDNKKRDKHLRSDDFFEMAKYPFIRFESTKIKKTSKGYKLIGKLTIKDITKKISVNFTPLKKFTQADKNKTLGFFASFTIDRFDYGMTWNKKFDNKIVAGKDIKINLEIVADKI